MADNQLGPLQPKQTTASDIRKVIANGTKTTGKGFTIANKDELEQKEVSKQSGLPKAVKIGGGVGANVGGTVGLNNNKTVVQPTVKAPKKEAPQGPVVQPTITKEQLTSDLFKNPIVQPINDVKIANINGESVNKTKLSNGVYDYNRNKLIIKTDAERKNDVYNGIKALYTDAYNKVTDGQQLTIQDVLGNEKYKKQFDGLDTTRLQELVNDANELAQYDDYDTQNILSVLDKHSDLGLTMNYNDLSPESKAAYLAEMSSGNVDSGLWKLVEMPGNLLSPLWWAEHAVEWGGKLFGKDIDIKTGNEQLRETVKGLKHDMLNEAETDAAARDEIAELDKKYAKYFTKNKDGEKKWNSVMKQADYEKDLAIIRDKVQSEHGDNNLLNLGKNTVLNLIEVASVVHDMIREPGTLISGLASTAVGGAENAAGYGWDVYDWLVNNNPKIEHKDITQHLADLGGYETFEDAIQSAEYNMKDSIYKDLAVGILKQIQKDSATAGLMGNYISESYGSTDKFLQSFGERPAETLSDIVTLLEGGAFIAGKAGLISPMKAEMLVESLGSLDPFEVGMKYGNKLNYGPILKGETSALKLGGKTMGAPFKGAKNMGDMIINKLTGTSEEERKFIRENPEDVDKFIKGKENSQSIIDKIVEKFEDLTSEKRKEGKEYELIKNSDTPVMTKDLIQGIKDELGKIGGKLTNKGITLSKRFSPAVNNKVNELYTYINDIQKNGNKATAEDLHWFRQQLDSLASWEKIPQGIEATFTNVVKDIRRLVDSSLKEQIPGMSELDKSYKGILADIKALRQDWFNKDGTLKDSAYSKIRNLTNKGANEQKLARLEKLIPGITQDLKALAVSETVEKATKQMVGQYAQQIRGVGGGITAIMGVLTGGASVVPSLMGLLGLTLATPKNLVSLLKFGGKIDKKINGVLDKIKNGTKLTALETAELARYLNENREDLREKAEYMHEKGLLSDEEYKAAMKSIDDKEYARAQQKARNKAGDKEVKLTPEDEKRVKEWINNNAKNPGFVIKMLDEVQMEAKTGDKTTQGFFYDKYINLLENPTDTTAQHEFFHGVFSLVDDKAKAYLIQEARKILKESGMDKVSAEEWLAESFGIYAKRKMIDMGVIKAPRSFEQKLRNFFQKVYEWIQNFNGDRKTINKVFEEIYGGNKTLKDGKLDLSELLGNKKVDKNVLNEVKLGSNGLRNKSVYHGSPADFDKFDSSHMGEGEGAQAHGRGHYVAVDEKTGRHYSDMGGEPSMRFRGERIKAIPSTPAEHAISDVELYIDGFEYDFKDAIETKTNDALRNIEYQKERLGSRNETPEGKANAKERIQFYNEYIKALKDMKERDFELVGNRNLYNLDIPDPKKANTPTGENYLNENKKLTEKEFSDFMEALKEKHPKEFNHPVHFDPLHEFYKEGDGLFYVDGKGLYNTLENMLGSDKAASKFLESLGYDGIHYFGGRDGEAYVIFNDDALQIKDHIRYKKKIGDKDVEITPKVTSPDELIEKNADGLSVMKSFISEKQAEKALDVNKALLDKDGNAYLWTHTNKYYDNPITNFENTKDSKYKEWTEQGKEISWVTNNEEMSKSYSDGSKTKLANTKAPRTEEEFNKWLKDKTKELQKEYGGQVFGEDEKLSFTVKEGKDGYYVEREIKNNNEVMDKDKFRRWVAMWQGLTMSDLEKKEKNLGGLEGLMKSQEDRLKNNGYANVDFKIDGDNVILNYSEIYKATPEFRDKKEFYAKAFSSFQGKNYYHYQGIIQDMKNPLVVDKGTNNWNQLGSVKEAIDEKKYNTIIQKTYKDAYYTSKVDDFRRELYHVDYNQDWDWKNNFIKDVTRELRYNNIEGIKDVIKEYEDKRYNIDDGFNRVNGELDGLQTFREIADEAINILEENKNGLRNASWKDYKEYLKDSGGDWLVEYIDRKLGGMDDNELMLDMSELRDSFYKEMDTNDWVRYALSKGEYDGVIFKNITDYGGISDSKKPGDVVAMFNSKQFKAWDNANPTDSKYISYKKKVSLDKKSEGLQKKDNSGLLAKGRDRMGDNGLRYKKEVPEDKKLIGLHNLSVDKLRKTVELGGMPMPSIAVTKKGIPHTDYGDVTFIMKESAINPKLNRNNKLYTVDGYTPMAQQPIVKMKDTKDAWAIEDKIEKETGLSYSEIEQWIENKEQMEYYHPELKKFDKEYNQMTEKKLWGGFTPSGKRRYLDYNLDNVVKKMKENKEDAFNGMYWKMVAQYEGETKTVDSLRERNYGLKNKEVGEELFNRYYSEVGDLYAKLGGGDSFREMGYFQDTLSYDYDRNTDRWLEKVKKDQPKGSIYEKLEKSDLEKLQKTIKEGAELQRPYSEAKPERGIRFDEVGAVVAPEGKLKEVKDMLKDTGLKVYGYKEGERMSVVDKVADDNGLRFKKKVDQTQTPEFKKWFEGSKVVDKSGKPLVMYHGTNSDFNTFDKGLIKSQNWGKGFYFTSNKEDAKQYGKNTKAVYLDVKNPLDLTSGENDAEYNKWYGKKNSPYDGYVVNLSNGDKMVVVKSPNQIKSATDNIGTFDKNNPDIRYKKGLQKKSDILTQEVNKDMGEFKASNGDVLKLSGEKLRAFGNDVYKITAKDPKNEMSTVLSYGKLENDIDFIRGSMEYDMDGNPEYVENYVFEKNNGIPIKDKSYVIYHLESTGEGTSPYDAGLKVKGKGYGTDLLNQLKKEAIRDGAKYIIAHDTTNWNSKSYWEKQGFEPIKGGNHILDLAKDEKQQKVNKIWGVKQVDGNKRVINFNGKELVNEKPDNLSQRDWKKQQFTNSFIFPIRPENKKYYDSFINFIEEKNDVANINGDGMKYTQGDLQHDFPKHGAFAPENLIETVNNPTDIVEHPFQNSNKKYYLKKIPGTNDYFKAVKLIEQGNTYTFFERLSGDGKAYENELKRGELPKEADPENIRKNKKK